MIALILLTVGLLAVAEEPAPRPVSSPTLAPAATVSKAKGKNAREKETEGTQALNRFETDTIIKSRYHLDGQPLEVDPD